MKLSNGKKAQHSAGGNGGKTALIAILAVIAVVLAGAAGGVAYVDKLDTIFPGVTVDGLEIGGLTEEEAERFLTAAGYGALAGESVTAHLPLDIDLTIRDDEVCTETDAAGIAAMAYDTCHGDSAVGNARMYLKARTGKAALVSGAELAVDREAIQAKVEGAAREVELALMGSDLRIGEESIFVRKGASGVSLDTAELTERFYNAFSSADYADFDFDGKIDTDVQLDIDSLYDRIYAEKADASFGENAEILPETVGMRFDREQAAKLWDAAVYGEEVEIPLIVDAPEVTAEELEKLLFRDKLSSLSTSLSGSTSNRVNNVKKAAGSINDVILMPGEEFSYNDALGKRTAENGYLLAGAYSGGVVVQEYGGGICQVSSTLYYCSLCANLKITARSCHYFPVSYISPGLDATVSWGGPEYKFVNSREYPIKIVSCVNEKDNTVSVEIWGTDTDGSYVEMTYGTSLVFDEEYPDVQIGYKASTNRNVYDASGKLLSSKREASSFYHFHDEDIKWPEPTEEPVETGEPVTETPAPTDPPVPTETPAPTEAPAATDPPAPTEAPVTETPAPIETEPPQETAASVADNPAETPAA